MKSSRKKRDLSRILTLILKAKLTNITANEPLTLNRFKNQVGISVELVEGICILQECQQWWSTAFQAVRKFTLSWFSCPSHNTKCTTESNDTWYNDIISGCTLFPFALGQRQILGGSGLHLPNVDFT